ncbi:MAG: contractile injection system protein, VgrG/Pvc8 family [Myxococcota bacterium]
MAEFTVDSPAVRDVQWVVLSVLGHEAINDLSYFEVVVAAAREDLNDALPRWEHDLLLLPAWLQFARTAEARRGIATERVNSRVFQDVYVHQIVSRVLFESGIRHRWALQLQYPKRLFCMQYRETDWAIDLREFYHA